MATKSPASGAQALSNGLAVLRVVSEAKAPISATEVAKRVGMHPSWVSRVLAALMRDGYVRKPDYRSYAADYGALALAGNALVNAPLAVRPRAALGALAERSGMDAVLAVLHGGQVIYLLRTRTGHEPVPLAVGYPLHLSSVALRLLLERPRAEALAALRESRRRYGWERPTPAVPEHEAEVLTQARARLTHGCLVLVDWIAPGHLGCAIPVAAPGEPPAALALSGPSARQAPGEALLWLQEGRRDIEAALAAQMARAARG
jgi:DNA-binding IclR family transcriptional regulator